MEAERIITGAMNANISRAILDGLQMWSMLKYHQHKVWVHLIRTPRGSMLAEYFTLCLLHAIVRSGCLSINTRSSSGEHVCPGMWTTNSDIFFCSWSIRWNLFQSSGGLWSRLQKTSAFIREVSNTSLLHVVILLYFPEQAFKPMMQ